MTVGQAMRILFVTQYFPPETGAAPARAEHFARALARAGHAVRVVTGLPNHPSGEIRPEYRRVRRVTESLDGITVERVWLHATPRKTPLTRLWNHLSFAVSALPATCAGPRADVVLASTPPLFLGWTAWWAARRHRAPLVLDCRDDWPRAAVALGELRPGPGTSVLSWIASFLHLRAARVIAVTPGMRGQLEARGLDAGRLDLIPNGADTELFRPAPGRNGAGQGPVVVLYAGTHGLVHGMETLLEAAEHFRGRGDVRFVLVGDGVAKPALERAVAERGLTHVEFHPSQTPARLVETIRSADVCVATTVRHEFSGETIPVKLFDYLACGRPVVAAVRGDAAEVVRSGGGIVVEPGDGSAMAAAIEDLVRHPERRESMGERGPGFVERHYSRRAAGERLATLLDEVHRRARGRPIRPRPGGLYGALRRVLDIAIAAAFLVALAPIQIAVAIAVRIDSPGPALFRQRRIGRGSAEFTILKFRTMRVGTPDLASHLMEAAPPRVTRLGRFLRRSSLDELPQLWNVLVGDMTLIGPRPALFNQDDLIAMRQEAGVDALRPGVTGWAQVHGRDKIALKTKVDLDRYYLEHVSPGLDLLILGKTVVELFTGRGAN